MDNIGEFFIDRGAEGGQRPLDSGCRGADFRAVAVSAP